MKSFRGAALCFVSICAAIPIFAIAESSRASTSEGGSGASLGTGHWRTIEDLNLKGAAADNPPFEDTILGVDSPIRRGLYRHGLLFHMSGNAAYIQNTLDAPVAVDTQTYTGQRQFGEFSFNPVLSADLR